MKYTISVLLLVMLAATGCKPAKQAEAVAPKQGAPSVTDFLDENSRPPATPEFDKHFFEGQSQKAIGNPDKAEAAFMLCYGLSPLHPVVNYELARLAFHKSDPEAESFAKRAYDTDRNNHWYASLLADIYHGAGQFEKAEKIYKAIIVYQPDAVETYFKLTDAQLRLKNPAGALKTLEKLEEVIGPSEELLMEKYRLWVGLGKIDKAEAEIVKLTEMNGRDVYSLSVLAGHYRDAGKMDKAAAVYQAMEKAEPNNGTVHFHKGEFLLTQGRMTEGFASLNIAMASPELEIDMKINVMLNLFALTEFESKYMEEIYALLIALEMAHPADPKAYSIHGDFLRRDGRSQEALTKFKKALEPDKSLSALWREVLAIEAETGQHALLAEDSRSALELFPLVPEFYYFNGFALTALGRYTEAMEALDSGLIILAENPTLEAEMHSLAGECAHKTGQYEKSDKEFRKALLLQPDNPTVLNNYAYYLALRKTRLDEARLHSEQSNKLAPGQPSFQDTMGYILYIQEDYSGAVTWYRKAIQSGGVNNPEILEHYGDALFQSGDAASALEHWKMAALSGGSGEALKLKIQTGKLTE